MMRAYHSNWLSPSRLEVRHQLLLPVDHWFKVLGYFSEANTNRFGQFIYLWIDMLLYQAGPKLAQGPAFRQPLWRNREECRWRQALGSFSSSIPSSFLDFWILDAFGPLHLRAPRRCRGPTKATWNLKEDHTFWCYHYMSLAMDDVTSPVMISLHRN